MHEDTPKNRLPAFLDRQIGNYEMLLLQLVTPLLRQELHRAIRMQRRALNDIKLQKDPQYLQELDTVHQRIQQHWTNVFGDLASHASLIENIGKFQGFVAGKLLEDYTGKPHTAKVFDVDQDFLVDWHDAAAEARGGSQDVGVHEGDSSENSAASQVRVGDECFDSRQNELLLEAYNLNVRLKTDFAWLKSEGIVKAVMYSTSLTNVTGRS
ncbi:hypothetical protein KVR01_013568 [Diaporthe batatas]|uniref:uncharacterized protein n=1 Tax=Diaporthe batatas TaxID=748121 RepID=UPI001D0401D8|nr:uncharacterized protein KVR01_013568 [Diaporthe batatas]KAG8156617.1 hypothetical protein KVR01_013568 [Diaporthe batatas]